MIEGHIDFYWPEDFHIQRVKFLHNLKGIIYKDKRPLNYLVTILNGDAYNLDLAKLNEWLKQIPSVLRKNQPLSWIDEMLRLHPTNKPPYLFKMLRTQSWLKRIRDE